MFINALFGIRFLLHSKYIRYLYFIPKLRESVPKIGSNLPEYESVKLFL